MKKSTIVLLISLGMVIGFLKDQFSPQKELLDTASQRAGKICSDACNQHKWRQTVTLENVHVDLDQNGYFDERLEFRKRYTISRKEMGVLMYEERGSRFIWIYRPGYSKPTYRVTVKSMKSFLRKKILPEHQTCCYLLTQNKRDGIKPDRRKSLIRFDLIDKMKLVKGAYHKYLEVSVPRLGIFTVQRDRAEKEKMRFQEYKSCSCIE